MSLGANFNSLNEPADRERSKEKHHENCKLWHDVAPIVISEVPYIPEAISIVRDLFRETLRLAAEIAFDGPGRAIPCGMSISRRVARVRSSRIDTVSRPSSRNSLSEGARVHENLSIEMSTRTPRGAARGVRASVS